MDYNRRAVERIRGVIRRVLVLYRSNIVFVRRLDELEFHSSQKIIMEGRADKAFDLMPSRPKSIISRQALLVDTRV